MKRTIYMGAITLIAIALCAQSSASQSTPPQAPTASDPGALTIPSGQKFILRLETAIHTHSTRKGERVEFTTAADVLVENQVVIPNRSRVRATVTKAKRAGRLFGRAEVRLRFDEVLLVDGTAFPLRATITRVGFDPVDAKDGTPKIKGEAGTGGNIGTVAQGGLQGAVIGVLSAGVKGAMYGSAAGAAIALAGMILRRGPDLDLPRDTMFEARFDQSLAVPPAVAKRAEQTAQSQPTEVQAQVSPADDSISKTRPILRRSGRVEQPPAETAANPQPPVETASIPPPPVEVAPIPPPPETTPPVTTPSQPAPASKEAQPTDPGAYKLSVNVRMVLVDAVVRDRAGRMMDNLTREDFRVYEDGVEQQIRSYSRDELPLAVALVIDRSGSVAPYIDELRRVAYRALQQLKPGDQVALFSFAGTVERLEDLTTDRRQIADGIARIRAGGSTDIIDALFDAVAYLAKVAPERRRAVILVSDNQPTVRPRASEGETIRMAMETETVVYSLKTSGETTPLTMRLPNLLFGAGSVHKVTQETGGEIIDVTSVGMLDAALGAVVSRLRLRYSLGYYPPDQGRGGAFHTLEVRLVERLGRPGSDYFMHARRGYYSTGDQTTSQSKP